MRAVLFDADGSVGLREVEPSAPAPGQVAVRSVCSLISAGTELHYLERARRTGVPCGSGYCAAGVVEEVGPGAGPFRPGDRVVAMGWGYALHAERICVPHRLCVGVPGGLPLERAVFAGLAATAVHAWHRAGVPAGAEVLVVGAGLVGLLVAGVAGAAGCRVTVADRLPNRLRAAEAAGAARTVETSSASLAEAVKGGTEAVFLCVHGEATELFEQSVRCLPLAPDGNRRGRIVVVGRVRVSVDLSAETGNVDVRVSSRCGTGYRDDDFVHGRRDYAAPPGEGTVSDNLRESLRLIRDGEIDPVPFHTHRFPFHQAADAYEVLRHPDRAIGVTLHHSWLEADTLP
ncbi:MAG TPA: zinc-binding dehydrogenase [Longimicrobiaceae bacterium]|nr:zinc-binding dehydrogenase [Longimicrobiaceae bacterium]